MTYKLSDFDYQLPEELIAQFPAQPRDHARLLVYDRSSGRITDDYFYNLTEHLPDETTLVVNNSRVEKCRLLFENGNKELFILNNLAGTVVEAMVRPGRKFRHGATVELENGLSARVLEIKEDGIRRLKLSHPLDDPSYEVFRVTPFPPYIKQNESLSEEYQTVYAADSGSKAAPTAGLHFTNNLIQEIRQKGFGWQELTLHVGLGTFAPVKTQQLENHKMHVEHYSVSEETAASLSSATHITAVGTTSVRVLESIVRQSTGRGSAESRQFRSGAGQTDIFIRPGYSYKSVDAMVTNFHLPGSTLLMLVAAFTGYDEMRAVYRHAIEQEYRFYSFGDAMLIR